MDAQKLRNVAAEFAASEKCSGVGDLDFFSIERFFSVMGAISEVTEKHGLKVTLDQLISLAHCSLFTQLSFTSDPEWDGGIAYSLEQLANTHVRLVKEPRKP